MGESEAPDDTSPSPSFTAPPLLEVALAVEFAPIANFGATTMAALATEWQARYPRVQEHPPLPPSLPVGATTPPAGGMMVSVGAPQIRLWLLSDSEDRLVQIQRDRMVVNWRLAASGQPYPRYHTALRPEFETNPRQLVTIPSPIPSVTSLVGQVDEARHDIIVAKITRRREPSPMIGAQSS